MNLLDQAYRILRTWADNWQPEAAGLLAFLGLTFGLLILTAIVTRRVLPWIGDRLVPLVLLIGANLIGFILLLMQGALVAPWRMARAQPPSAIFGMGDAVVVGMLRTQQLRLSGRLRVRWLSYPARWSRLLAIAATWWWSRTYCARQDAEGCVDPFTLAFETGRSLWRVHVGT